ncbi:TRPM8 channel-associated factor homolog [Ascaphus truei]|uniref:TRPM8 channel-associated factor homolog n=1 Tax=Ascaphus truei TaxID=8439 RepID=UPI003F59DC36
MQQCELTYSCCPVCNNPPTRRFQGQTRSPEKGMPNPESPGETRRGGNPEWCPKLYSIFKLQEGFGWEPFIQLFSDYQKMSIKKDVNTYKMNLWAEKFSLQVKKNLVPFFKMWGWPIEDEVSKKVSTLPEWEENPMKKYITL